MFICKHSIHGQRNTTDLEIGSIYFFFLFLCWVSFFVFLFLFVCLFVCLFFVVVFSAFGVCFLWGRIGFSFFVLFSGHQLQADLRLLATQTCSAWWSRYCGHWRSAARNLSPQSRVYAQESHRKDIHSHIHSHPAMHTPKTKSKTLNSLNMTPSFTCPFPVQCPGGRRLGSLADAPQTYFSTVQSLRRRRIS